MSRIQTSDFFHKNMSIPLNCVIKMLHQFEFSFIFREEWHRQERLHEVGNGPHRRGPAMPDVVHREQRLTYNR